MPLLVSSLAARPAFKTGSELSRPWLGAPSPDPRTRTASERWLAFLYKRRETLGEGRITKGHLQHLKHEVSDLQLSQIKAPAKGRPQIAKAATDVHNAFEADPVLKDKIDQGLLELIQQISSPRPGKVRRGEPKPRQELVKEILARWRPRPPQSREDEEKFGARGGYVGKPELTFPLLLHFSENVRDLHRCCRLTPTKRSQELDRIEARLLLQRHGHMFVSRASSNRFVVLREHLAIYRTLNHTTVRCSVRATVSRWSVHVYDDCSASIELCKVLEAEAFGEEQRREARTASSVQGAYPNRGVWLEHQMKIRDNMRPYRMRKAGGADQKTIKKILAGESVSENALLRVTKGLSKDGALVLRDDIPND